MRAVFSLLKGTVVFVLYVINTLFWALPLLLLSVLKLIPIKPLRKLCSIVLDAIASCWISCNAMTENLFHPLDMQVLDWPLLDKNTSYMIVANHQSWVDILILQKLFNRKIPFLKFFLKKELIFVPVLGLAWWALDFPFMRRYSAADIKHRPELRGKDIEITKKACDKFKHHPVSIMNFVEGTRFTPEKHAKQHSPFTHLLRPKAGGLAFALSAMGEQIDKLIDVTIHYPEKTPSFFDYISGRLKQVNIAIEVRPITAEMRGDYLNNRQFKQEFQHQLNQIWQDKDKAISILKNTNNEKYNKAAG